MKAVSVGSVVLPEAARLNLEDPASGSVGGDNMVPGPGRTSWSSGRHGAGKASREKEDPWARALVAEAVGTMMIVLFGCGCVCATLTDAYVGIWQVASVWGVAVAVAICCTAEVSGAHLNPAVTLAFWLVRPSAHGMTRAKAGAYMLAQLGGAIAGGLMNLALYDGTIRAFERAKGIKRGTPESVLSAAAFGEYFPNPGLASQHGSRASGSGFYRESDVSVFQACFVEAWGTFVLCFVIFAVTHDRNPVLQVAGARALVPFVIGATVAMLLALYAPITQAGWNPARDLGPRIVVACAGWGQVALPGPRGGFWVYIVGPCIGGPLGAAAAENVLHGSALDRAFAGAKRSGGATSPKRGGRVSGGNEARTTV